MNSGRSHTTTFYIKIMKYSVDFHFISLGIESRILFSYESSVEFQ